MIRMSYYEEHEINHIGKEEKAELKWEKNQDLRDEDRAEWVAEE